MSQIIKSICKIYCRDIPSFRVSMVVQSLSCVWLSATPWTAALQTSLSFTISWSLLRLMSIEAVMSSAISCLLLLPLIFPIISVFSSESVLHIRWPLTGASASASVLSVNIQGWFLLELTGLIFLSKWLSRVFSSPTVWKYQLFGTQHSLWSNSHIQTRLVEKP